MAALSFAVFGINNRSVDTGVKVLLLFLFVVWAALVFWTYADARRRIDDPMLVACATAASLFPFVGTIVYTIAPERIVIGGSVAELPGLFPLVREKLLETMAGYGALPEHAADDFVVPAGLGGLAGPAGALVLAENALLAEKATARG